MSPRENSEGATGSGSEAAPPRRTRFKPPPAEETASAGSSGLQLTPRPWTITLPDDEDYFTIREDQLDALAHGGKNMAMEWVFFCGGAALGLLPSVAPVALAIIEQKPMSWFDRVLAVIAVGLGVYAYAKYSEANSNRIDVDRLKEKIKADQKKIFT